MQCNELWINYWYTTKRKYTIDGERVKAYLEQTGQSANSYIKALIKADLDAKGFCVDCATMDSMDIKSLESNNDTDNSWN